MKQALESCELEGGWVISKEHISQSWEELKQSTRTAEDFETTAFIMLDMNRLLGNKDDATANPQGFTERDFARFGIKRDEYLTLLDETAMNLARGLLKQAR